jgi:hypothetical protein
MSKDTLTPTQAPSAELPQSRMQIAMEMVLELLEARLRDTCRELERETVENAQLVAGLIELGQGEIGRMRAKVYSDYDDFAAELVRVRTLLQATAAMYGVHDTMGSWYIERTVSGMNILFDLVEHQENQTGSDHSEGACHE